MFWPCAVTVTPILSDFPGALTLLLITPNFKIILMQATFGPTRFLLLICLGFPLWSCSQKTIDNPRSKGLHSSNYSDSDLSEILQFANRFALADEDAQSQICRDLTRVAADGQNIDTGLILHAAAAELFVPTCTPSAPLHARLVALSQDESAPADQRNFAIMTLRLKALHEDQGSRLPIKKGKARKPSASPATPKPQPTDRKTPTSDEAKTRKPEAPITSDDALARKKLEALRNLEKAMDRSPTP